MAVLSVTGGIAVLIAGGLGAWVLTADNPLENPLGGKIAWPVACSSRGCITTLDWQQNLQARKMFSQVLEESPPTATQALTTTIRHHLVKHALLSSSVTLEDARRYRKEILHLDDEKLVKETSGLTLDEYDKMVLMPLLRQEALRQQYHVESFDDLFKQLARDRRIVVLPLGLTWNREEAKVEEN